MSKLKFYKDKKGFHRWRLTAPNGEIIGASSQGFSKKSDAIHNATILHTELKKNLK